MVSHAYISLESVNLFPLRTVKCVDFCSTNKQVDSTNTELESL